MPRRSSDVSRALARKGFEERRSGDHLFYAYITADGLRSNVRTKVSHGGVHEQLQPNHHKQQHKHDRHWC